MLVEFAVIPLGVGESLAAPLAQTLKIVDDSRIPYKLTPSGTCLEGSWDEVMAVIRACHASLRQQSNHVITTLRIEDDAGETDQLHRNIASLEEKLGRKLAH
jgi:uncharacterized protein (TIGR00106 family)